MHDLDAIHNSPILIVDDNEANVAFLENLLELGGYTNVHSAINADDIVVLCLQFEIDLVLLDLHMPGTDGYEALRLLKTAIEDVPVLVFTADASFDAKKRALALGASDFLTKPGDATEIGLRVHNFLAMRHLYRHVMQESIRLEIQVNERTKELQAAQVEILGRLAMASEYRDDDTGQHTRRVSKMAFEIALQLQIDPEEASLIRFASLLHDVGKIGIPDSILRKPGKLNREEVLLMREHTTIGAKLLGQSKAKLLQMAEMIALAHHERWDGTGYPKGIRGESIPMPARIVSIADSFDAMISRRVYKEAMPIEKAVAEIMLCSGSQFDPVAVCAFLAVVRRSIGNNELLLAA